MSKSSPRCWSNQGPPQCSSVALKFLGSISSRRDDKLRDDVLDHLSWVDAGELLVEALEREGELVVINAELMEDRSVKVTNGHFVFDDIV